MLKSEKYGQMSKNRRGLVFDVFLIMFVVTMVSVGAGAQLEKTGDISEVTIQPIDERMKTFPGGAIITLQGYPWKTTDLNGVVIYKDVPFGDYRIIVVCEKYVQQEDDYKEGSVAGFIYHIDSQTEYYQPKMTGGVIVRTPPSEERNVPGFGAIFAIAGLLAVAYLFRDIKNP